ncbi:MAG: NYN domain-containing protein [Actinomycetota bacterium]
MKSLIIVDGYNFIFKYFDNKAITGDGLEILRGKLVDDLIQYGHAKSFDIIVVFDSNKSSQNSRNSSKIGGVEVIYSGKTKNADSVIEEISHSREGYDKKFIVTSDNIQQTVIFRENIYRKSVREFAIELNQQKTEVRSRISELGKTSSSNFSSIEKRLGAKSKEEFSLIIKKLAGNPKNKT